MNPLFRTWAFVARHRQGVDARACITHLGSRTPDLLVQLLDAGHLYEAQATGYLPGQGRLFAARQSAPDPGAPVPWAVVDDAGDTLHTVTCRTPQDALQSLALACGYETINAALDASTASMLRCVPQTGASPQAPAPAPTPQPQAQPTAPQPTRTDSMNEFEQEILALVTDQWTHTRDIIPQAIDQALVPDNKRGHGQMRRALRALVQAGHLEQQGGRGRAGAKYRLSQDALPQVKAQSEDNAVYWEFDGRILILVPESDDRFVVNDGAQDLGTYDDADKALQAVAEIATSWGFEAIT